MGNKKVQQVASEWSESFNWSVYYGTTINSESTLFFKWENNIMFPSVLVIPFFSYLHIMNPLNWVELTFIFLFTKVFFFSCFCAKSCLI